MRKVLGSYIPRLKKLKAHKACVSKALDSMSLWLMWLEAHTAHNTRSLNEACCYLQLCMTQSFQVKWQNAQTRLFWRFSYLVFFHWQVFLKRSNSTIFFLLKALKEKSLFLKDRDESLSSKKFSDLHLFERERKNFEKIASSQSNRCFQRRLHFYFYKKIKLTLNRILKIKLEEITGSIKCKRRKWSFI